MQNILIVIHGMGCGGAEKSLISLLHSLPKNKWNIDLIVASPYGRYMDEIPDFVHVISDLYDLENYATELRKRRKKVCGIRDLFCQTKWQIQYRLNLCPELMFDETRWKFWGKYLPKLDKEYDLAVSYLNGLSSYFVIDKVNAKKKILWVHNEFEKIGYNYEFEYPFYQKADKVVTVSQACVDSFLRVYPEFKDKIVVLENISSRKTIIELSKDKVEDTYFTDIRTKLLSVGRLSEQKNYKLAVSAAKLLADMNVDFVWYILGEGELRDELQKMVDECGLTERFKMVGIKANPYPYISDCDIFVQSSLYEGKSIALDEAKILCKPIVVTNYATAKNSVSNGVNGVISDMTPESLAKAIYSLTEDKVMCQRLSDQLKSENNGNDDEIGKYIALFEKCLSCESQIIN